MRGGGYGRSRLCRYKTNITLVVGTWKLKFIFRDWRDEENRPWGTQLLCLPIWLTQNVRGIVSFSYKQQTRNGDESEGVNTGK